jgi:hypothetical protein
MSYGTLQKKSETENTQRELGISCMSHSNRPEWKPNKDRPTPEQVANLLRVDDNGKLFWLRRNKPVGSVNANGYLVIGINGSTYVAHHLAFVLYEGRWPELGKVINHLNGNKTDNRRCNLQETTHAGNLRHRVTIPANNTSGGIGVSWYKPYNKWRVRLNHNYVSYHGGFYSDLNEAIAARDKLALSFGHNQQANFVNISNEIKL